MENVIAVAFTLMFLVFLFTNSFKYGYWVLIYAVLPLAFVPTIRSLDDRMAGKSWFDFSNPLATLQGLRSNVFWAAAAYLGLMLAFTCWNPEPNTGVLVRGIPLLLTMLALMLVAARLSASVRVLLPWMMLVIAPAVALNALINIWIAGYAMPSWTNLLDQRLNPEFGMATGTFVTRSSGFWAVYSSAILAAAIAFKDLKSRLFLLFCIACIMTALLLTQGRGALLAALISFSALALLSSERNLRLLALVAIGVVIVVVASIPQYRNGILLRGDNFARLEIWQIVTSNALSHPLWGVGLGVERTVTLKDSSVHAHAHNIFVSALLLCGLPGLIAFCLAFLKGWWQALRAYLSGNNGIAFGMMSCVLVAGLADYELILRGNAWQWSTFWIPLGFCIGCGLKSNSATTAIRSKSGELDTHHVP